MQSLTLVKILLLWLSVKSQAQNIIHMDYIIQVEKKFTLCTKIQEYILRLRNKATNRVNKSPQVTCT